MTLTDTADFPPFVVIDGDPRRGIVLLADHARRDVPEPYGDLGLPRSEFDRHIAYDIGVEGVLVGLARRLGVPAVYAAYSRLLIDPNRGEDDPTLIRQIYDGTVIPANYPLADGERAYRIERFYRPYHDAVAELIASVAVASGGAPLIFSVHSFTPAMQGRQRPWHAGVLWDKDDRAARPLIEMLGADPLLVVGDNEPYDGALKGDTLYRHAIVSGFAHVLLEIRQDLIADAAGQDAWARRLAPIVDAIAARPDIGTVSFHGSRTGPLPGASS